MERKTRNKTALVFGSTGLTGRFLTKLLLNDERYSIVKVFSRKKPDMDHHKLQVIVNDLTSPASIADEIKGDDLFCCLGTTMKRAGSRKVFEQVDYHLPVELARIASENKVNKFIVVSSTGASKKSWSFYLRTKGKMEEGILSHTFGQVTIMRPSLLLGPREEKRTGESFAKNMSSILSFLYKGPLKKYRPIQAETVARAMLSAANNVNIPVIFESNLIDASVSKKYL